MTSELPAEAIYLYESENSRWFSPTYLPLRDAEAEYDTNSAWTARRRSA